MGRIGGDVGVWKRHSDEAEPDRKPPEESDEDRPTSGPAVVRSDGKEARYEEENAREIDDGGNLVVVEIGIDEGILRENNRDKDWTDNASDSLRIDHFPCRPTDRASAATDSADRQRYATEVPMPERYRTQERPAVCCQLQALVGRLVLTALLDRVV